jgi:hypothetical protein
MRRLLFVALVGAAAGAAGCSSAVPLPSSNPDPLEDSGAADARVDTGTATDGGRPDASEGGLDSGQDAPSDAGSEAQTGDAGAETSSSPPPPTAICDTTASWGTGGLIALTTASDDELDTVTPDELSIAWTVGSGSAATIEYADRSTSTDPFGTPQALAAGQFTADRVSLSADGLRLVVVDADGQGFSELVRVSRVSPDNTFGAPSVGGYANLDAPAALATGQSYGDPVLAADDNAFYYSVYGGGQTTTIFRATRLVSGDSWEVGSPLTSSTGLAAQGSLRRRPTGISSDGQTLFFWDEVQGVERAAWIDQSTGAFDVFVDLGTRSMAAPESTCSRLYYSAPGTESINLFVAAN